MIAKLDERDLIRLSGAAHEMRRLGFRAACEMILLLIAEVRRLRSIVAEREPGSN